MTLTEIPYYVLGINQAEFESRDKTSCLAHFCVIMQFILTDIKLVSGVHDLLNKYRSQENPS